MLARSASGLFDRTCETTFPSKQSTIADRQHMQASSVNWVMSVSQSLSGASAWKTRLTLLLGGAPPLLDELGYLALLGKAQMRVAFPWRLFPLVSPPVQRPCANCPEPLGCFSARPIASIEHPEGLRLEFRTTHLYCFHAVACPGNRPEPQFLKLSRLLPPEANEKRHGVTWRHSIRDDSENWMQLE